MKKAYFFILSFFLILLVIFWIGPSRIIYSVSRADLLIILMALAVHIMVLAVRGLKWGFIIGQTGRFRVNFIVKTIGLFAGNLSPMRSEGRL